MQQETGDRMDQRHTECYGSSNQWNWRFCLSPVGPGDLEACTRKEYELTFISVEPPVWKTGQELEDRTQQTSPVKAQVVKASGLADCMFSAALLKRGWCRSSCRQW